MPNRLKEATFINCHLFKNLKLTFFNFFRLDVAIAVDCWLPVQSPEDRYLGRLDLTAEISNADHDITRRHSAEWSAGQMLRQRLGPNIWRCLNQFSAMTVACSYHRLQPQFAATRSLNPLARGERTAAGSDTRPSFVIDGADLYIDCMAAKLLSSMPQPFCASFERDKLRSYSAQCASAIKLILLYEGVLALVAFTICCRITVIRGAKLFDWWLTADKRAQKRS